MDCPVRIDLVHGRIVLIGRRIWFDRWTPATLGNSKIGAEIRSTRMLVRDIVELTISGDLDSLIRKRLTEVAQLLQIYARLAEHEIASGERPKAGEVALPEGTARRIAEKAIPVSCDQALPTT